MFRKKSIGVRGAAMRHGDVAAPDAGDIIWLDFLQPVANEQAGRRPALVLSPRIFNELTGRCIACPITRGDRDWSFHVSIPDGHEITGVVHCAGPHGSSEDRVLYARLPLACLTKYEQGSSRCSRFNRAAGLGVGGEACSKADWIRISVETQALTAGKWILNRQLINHLPLLQIFRVENGTSGTHCRSDDQAVID